MNRYKHIISYMNRYKHIISHMNLRAKYKGQWNRRVNLAILALKHDTANGLWLKRCRRLVQHNNEDIMRIITLCPTVLVPLITIYLSVDDVGTLSYVSRSYHTVYRPLMVLRPIPPSPKLVRQNGVSDNSYVEYLGRLRSINNTS